LTEERQYRSGGSLAPEKFFNAGSAKEFFRFATSIKNCKKMQEVRTQTFYFLKKLNEIVAKLRLYKYSANMKRCRYINTRI